jgi:cytochrome P450
VTDRRRSGAALARRAGQWARLVGRIYGQQALVFYWAYARDDVFSRLARPSGRTDPYPLYERLRAKGPIVPTRLGNYVTTSHPLCKDVLRSRNFGVVPADGTQDLVHDEALDLSLLILNPPDHTRIRRLAAPAFTPRRMAGYAGIVDRVIAQLLDRAEPEAEFDLMAAFAAPLPIAVMTQLLGLPDDAERFRRLGSIIGQGLDGVWSLRQARTLQAADEELRNTFDDLLTQRARAPGDDLVSGLVVERGDSLSGRELAALVQLLLIAGFETTVNAIGNGMRWLLADPEQWRALVDDPARAGAVAEEVLRFDPPVQQTARVAHTDVDVGGVRVRTNQWVVTLLAAANRDPEVYPDPNRFDITREAPAEHLAFSGGIHYCLGSPLARLELTRAFQGLAERFPRMRRSGPITMRSLRTLRGPQRFPVAVS